MSNTFRVKVKVRDTGEEWGNWGDWVNSGKKGEVSERYWGRGKLGK